MLDLLWLAVCSWSGNASSLKTTAGAAAIRTLVATAVGHHEHPADRAGRRVSTRTDNCFSREIAPAVLAASLPAACVPSSSKSVLGLRYSGERNLPPSQRAI